MFLILFTIIKILISGEANSITDFDKFKEFVFNEFSIPLVIVMIVIAIALYVISLHFSYEHISEDDKSLMKLLKIYVAVCFVGLVSTVNIWESVLGHTFTPLSMLIYLEVCSVILFIVTMIVRVKHDADYVWEAFWYAIQLDFFVAIMAVCIFIILVFIITVLVIMFFAIGCLCASGGGFVGSGPYYDD